MTNRKLSILLAFATTGVLVVMVAVSLVTGATQEAHEHFATPASYALGLVEHGNALRIVMALDVAFLVLYTAFFAALAGYLRDRGRPFVMLALGAMVLTALLDIVEDHHIITMLDAAEHGVLPTVAAISFQATESATKFSVSFLSLVLFGLAVPRDTKLGLALALFLTVGTLITAVIGYAAPPEMQHGVDSSRWIGFLGGFVLAIAWLRTAPEPTVTPA